MDELTEWLRDQLAEDEAILLRASGGLRFPNWSLDEWFGRERPHSLIAQGTPEQPVVGRHFTADPIPTVQGEHIVRHDPARVLREIDAKRRIVDDLAQEIRWAARMSADYRDGADVCQRTLKLLALPYADRPGYREEWRP